MIRFDIHENGAVLQAYRNALRNNTQGHNDVFVEAHIEEVNLANNCRIIGSMDAGGWWCTDAIEFDTEEALSMFLLRWT